MSDLQQPFIKNVYEEWKDIEVYPVRQGMYEISNTGKVRNKITGQELSPYIMNSGYLTITLCTNNIGENCHCLIHRLVAIAFIPNPYNKKTVNHLDNKLFNYVWYLEWATLQDNISHAFNTGRMNSILGQNQFMSVLTNEQVEQICYYLSMGKSYSKIVEILGLGSIPNIYDLIGNIKRRISWNHISYKYTFPDADLKSQGNNIFDYDTIRNICKAIAEEKTIKEIIEEVLHQKYISCSTVNKREYEAIRRIKNKLQFTSISDSYF